MTRKEAIGWFRWAYSQASDMLGAHTGGPNESDYRRYLAETREAIEVLKKPRKRKR